jgi:hypothetical protein
MSGFGPSQRFLSAVLAATEDRFVGWQLPKRFLRDVDLAELPHLLLAFLLLLQKLACRRSWRSLDSPLGYLG